MADRITISVAGKGRTIAEPPFFLLRQIIDAYNDMVSAPPAQLSARVRRLFILVFGWWRGNWLFMRLKPAELTGFLAALPAQIGLEPGSKAATDASSWGDVYAHLSATFSWDYDAIDQHMTLGRLKAMQGYLKNNPPTHLLVAAYLNYEPPLTPAEKRKRFFERFSR
ncbi:MAG: hypothetical protein PHH59_15460 [Methylovulum sp.]|uniref:hypothetical protein n=1 Tax=Methylovulum sp. TaxID=1916980 RepID=UPI00260E6564|nr:hypothetical protein [Methylovulum sp.]MDD2725402.1 hypothetical protein [Methylovulum sp.]MDD5124353.1 hypothetical protein [Methylovulum sp.]